MNELTPMNDAATIDDLYFGDRALPMSEEEHFEGLRCVYRSAVEQAAQVVDDSIRQLDNAMQRVILTEAEAADGQEALKMLARIALSIRGLAQVEQ